jgi:hypothetical protein
MNLMIALSIFGGTLYELSGEISQPHYLQGNTVSVSIHTDGLVTVTTDELYFQDRFLSPSLTPNTWEAGGDPIIVSFRGNVHRGNEPHKVEWSDIFVSVNMDNGYWLESHLDLDYNVYPSGDANRDRIFNSTDLVNIFQLGVYEQDVASDWSSGDFNLDQRANSSDLVDAFQYNAYTLNSVFVPEPSAIILMLIGAINVFYVKKRFI